MAIEPNIRYIDIDDNTKVGYNYPKAQFYVENKDTTTYRDLIEDIEDVLKAIGIEIGSTVDIHGEVITTARIQALKDNIETLETTSIDEENTIYYTGIKYAWDSTGSYIHSIQFNNWENYPIILDCSKAKLYINNSTIVFDLLTNESPEVVRIPVLCSFYEQTLGLYIPKEVMLALYNLLISYYSTDSISIREEQVKSFFLNHACTNQIRTRETEEEKKELARYNGTFQTSNYGNTTPVVYKCINDPYNITDPQTIGYISSIDNTTNTITTTDNISEEIIEKYNIEAKSKLLVHNAETTIEGTTYILDGYYTVNTIKDNTITVEEPITTSYIYPFYSCYVIDSSYSITNMNRDNNTITVSSLPNTLLIGDTITVIGASVPSTYETIVLDGTYTVQAIQGNTITVEEQIATNFSSTGAYLYKEIFVSEIKNMPNNTTINLLKSTTFNLVNATIVVYNSNRTERSTSKVNTQPDTSTLTIETPITISMVDYPQLQYPAPNKDMLISISKSISESTLPIGDFIVDDFSQVIDYLSLAEDKHDDINNKSLKVNLPTTDTDGYGNKGIKASMYSPIATDMRVPVEVRGADVYYMYIIVKGNGIFQEEYQDIAGIEA